MNDIFEALKQLAGDPSARGVLAEIAATTGSSPRKRGARMLLGPDGVFSGTVGGGGLEYHVQRDALRFLETGAPARKVYSLGTNPGEAVGSVCGGSAAVEFRFLGAEQAAELLRCAPRPPRVLLYGAGHVGRALADLLHLLDMAVVVTDERTELLTPERFPHAARRLRPAAEAAVDAEAEDYVVITTHSHALDYVLVREALRSPAHYVGMIGSRRKNALFRPRLLRDGIAQDAIDARLRSPIGLPIGAQTPEEIAVSIAAEIVADRNRPQ